MLDDGGDCQQAGARLLRQGRTGEAGGKFLGDEVRGELAGGEARQADQRGQEADIVADAADFEGVEGLAHARDRFGAIGSMTSPAWRSSGRRRWEMSAPS